MKLRRVDLGMYVRAIPLLLRHPSILAMPVLAGVVDWAVGEISPFLTDAVGGAGAWIFQIVVQLVYGLAFGIAVIQASNAWRGRHATFDEAWEEGRRKWGGIVLAAIGFYFIVYAGAYVGSLIGVPLLGIALQVVAAFFLIYSIPAAAIGGLPGSLALSASIRAVRSDALGAAILAIVFVALWYELVQYVPALPLGSNPAVYGLAIAAVRALVLGYLAFPFAKQYDDVAFRGLW